MFRIQQIIKGIKALLSCALLLGSIVFAEARQARKPCRAINIAIVSKTAQRFVEKEDLVKQLTANDSISIVGEPLQTLVTRKIETIIKSNSFVGSATVYKSWKGVLKVVVTPRRAIARVLYSHQPSQYIDHEGTLLPLSAHYTARVPLIETEELSVASSLKESAYGRALLELLTYINREPFWQPQIVHMRIDQQGKITMYTQVGKQRVEFGWPEAIENKFARLEIFYKKIIPYKGWSTYGRVNLEFANQILCE